MMIAYYDLAHSPPTYDIIAFLCEVERERLKRGEEDVEIVFLPGPVGGFRGDPYWPQSIAERVKLRECVAKPICWLLPAVRDVRVAVNRDEARADRFGVGIGLYGLARQVAASRDGIRPLRAETTEPGRYITVTLRECDHWPERNSNVVEWIRAVECLHDWRVIVLRDTKFAADPLLYAETHPLASVDIAARASLYAGAAVNLCVSNGPGWMAMAMDAPVLMMRPATEGVGGPFGAKYLAGCGIEPGGQMPGAPPHQRLVWQDDTADAIVDAFHAYIADMRVAA